MLRSVEPAPLNHSIYDLALEHLTKVLLSGSVRLHAFRSGGGLRVVRLERKKKLIGYGEHPYIESALIHAAEDEKAGGRPYEEVYGANAKEPHYLTGSSEASSPLDAWVKQGQDFDAWAEKKQVVAQLKEYTHQEWPEDLLDRARAGETGITWTSPRGFTFRFEPMRFANGEIGVSIPTIGYPPGREKHDSSWYSVSKTGRASTLAEAIAIALNAPEVEVLGKD